MEEYIYDKQEFIQQRGNRYQELFAVEKEDGRCQRQSKKNQEEQRQC